jgi:hypothetical protein
MRVLEDQVYDQKPQLKMLFSVQCCRSGSTGSTCFLSHRDPDPLVRGMDLDPDPTLNPDPDPFIIMQK